PPAADGRRDQPRRDSGNPSDQRQRDEQTPLHQQQPSGVQPGAKEVQRTGQQQGRQRSPEQRNVAVVVGTRGQYRYQFGIGALLHIRNGSGNPRLFILGQQTHAHIPPDRLAIESLSS